VGRGYTRARGEGVSLRRKLSIIALVYVIEGFPMGVFRDLWPVYFRREAMPLPELGLLSGLILLWSLKVLWSPLIDRFAEQRRWIAGCLAVMAASLFALPDLDAGHLGPLLFGLLVAYCAASATQDVAIDAYTICLVERGEEGPANSMRITAYRGGLIAAGGWLVMLADGIGFGGTFLLAGVFSLLMAGLVLVCPRVTPLREERESDLSWLGRWITRRHVWAVGAFILLYRIGDIAMGPMVKPFWVDRGFSNVEIGFVSGTLGPGALVAGAWLGGWVVARAGIGRALWWLGGLALLSNFAYAGAAALPEALRYPVYAASLIESFCAGLASNAFMSFLMNIAEKEHAAVQYALLTAIYALPGTLTAAVSGFLTEEFGYAAFFAPTGLLALPAFAFLPRARRWIGAGA
jgi:PAT family beta-lactamase induction signal transducer AmpG